MRQRHSSHKPKKCMRTFPQRARKELLSSLRPPVSAMFLSCRWFVGFLSSCFRFHAGSLSLPVARERQENDKTHISHTKRLRRQQRNANRRSSLRGWCADAPHAAKRNGPPKAAERRRREGGHMRVRKIGAIRFAAGMHTMDPGTRYVLPIRITDLV
jgi:hypothetical protein